MAHEGNKSAGRIGRRGFLGAAATLLAAAVVPGTARALTDTDRDELAGLLKNGGTISHREFILYDGQPIDMSGLSNLTIRNCTFRWRGTPLKSGVLLIGDTTKNVLVEDCVFTNEAG